MSSWDLTVAYNQMIPIIASALKDLLNRFESILPDVKALKEENVAIKDSLKAKDKEIESLKAYLCKKDPKAPFCDH